MVSIMYFGCDLIRTKGNVSWNPNISLPTPTSKTLSEKNQTLRISDTLMVSFYNCCCFSESGYRLQRAMSLDIIPELLVKPEKNIVEIPDESDIHPSILAFSKPFFVNLSTTVIVIL